MARKNAGETATEENQRSSISESYNQIMDRFKRIDYN